MLIIRLLEKRYILKDYDVICTTHYIPWFLQNENTVFSALSVSEELNFIPAVLNCP